MAQPGRLLYDFGNISSLEVAGKAMSALNAQRVKYILISAGDVYSNDGVCLFIRGRQFLGIESILSGIKEGLIV